ncbi:VaFE repeat-containing surface-anchored protein [Ilumatobacter sp.]|uniref:VaFE repeat-containing surface-anchored protein n=1 Tax=Ilumatobacter sp. TaxID=1967498 RepID=UPI003C3330AC
MTWFTGGGRPTRLARIARCGVAMGVLVALAAVDSARPHEPVVALPPTLSACAGNSAFCGAILRIDSDAGTIPSVAAGAHYGPVWGIPQDANNSTGIGWCVDDTHTGYPVAPIEELPLPTAWTTHDMRRAATLITLYGEDTVLPYQPLPVDASGELIGVDAGDFSSTRHRQIAVWFALRSILSDPTGTPRIDLDSATTFSDSGARSPSAAGNSAMKLAQKLVTAADAMTPAGTLVVTVTVADGTPPTSPGVPDRLRVHVADSDGRPLPNHPVWPTASTNATVTSPNDDPASSSVAFRNAAQRGWPSIDLTRTLGGATVTDDQGDAVFDVEIDAAGPWRVGFETEASPAVVHLFGDDINAQNNITVLDGVVRASGSLHGEVEQRFVRVVKTSSDPTFGVEGAEIALIDADGTEVARGTSGSDGIIDFGPLAANHPTPLAVREITAPAGLRPLGTDVEIVTAGPVSSDPTAPTVVEIGNSPITHELIVQKAIDGSAGFGSDLSGFTFAVTRDVDGADFGAVTTDQTGRTSSVAVPAGDYSIAEVARPARWPGDEPFPDPNHVTVPTDPTTPIVVRFDNALRHPTLSTSATDQADGDKYLAADGGTIVDHVEVCGAVEGTTYTVAGELAFVPADGEPAERTGIVATVDFVAAPSDRGCISVELHFDVPAESDAANDSGVFDGSGWLDRPGHLVVTEQLFVDGELVARHDDLTSIEQSIYVAKVGSVAVDAADGDHRIDIGGGAIIETLTISDLDPSRPDVELRADSTLMTITPDGTVQATAATGATIFTPADLHAVPDSDGTTSETGDVEDDGRDTQPIVEILYSSTDLAREGGTGVVFTTITDVATGLVIAEHHDPAAMSQQVRWEPETVETTVAPPTPTAPAPAPSVPPVHTDNLPRTGGDSTMRLLRAGMAVALLGSSLVGASRIRVRRRRTSV